jgi:hypothetical protein
MLVKGPKLTDLVRRVPGGLIVGWAVRREIGLRK